MSEFEDYMMSKYDYWISEFDENTEPSKFLQIRKEEARKQIRSDKLKTNIITGVMFFIAIVFIFVMR
ncbi:MAG: hypothetical protein OEY79_00100 [Anaplasmataceae bacterium]|nr:hypothetical protein [Anaplasmataceae bacterium]